MCYDACKEIQMMQVKAILPVFLLLSVAMSVMAVGQTKAPAKAPAKPVTTTGERLKDNRDGTVTDKKTGLMWQQDDDRKQRNWSESQDYCGNLSLAGHKDWRLPSIQNLTDLFQVIGSDEQVQKKYFPRMITNVELYPGIVAGYWSSTVGGGRVLPDTDKDEAGIVSFHDGAVQTGAMNFFALYCRCVRLVK
jgi:hypothetical protein